MKKSVQGHAYSSLSICIGLICHADTYPLRFSEMKQV